MGRIILEDGNSRVTGRRPGSTRILGGAYFTSQETSRILGGAYISTRALRRELPACITGGGKIDQLNWPGSTRKFKASQKSASARCFFFSSALVFIDGKQNYFVTLLKPHS